MRQTEIRLYFSPSPEGLFILILSDVSKLLMDFVVLVHKDIFAECNGY